MAKPTWRDRLKKYQIATLKINGRYYGVMKRSNDGDYVSGRRVDTVISALEREINGLTGERDEAQMEVERLRGAIVRSEKVKLHLIRKLKDQRQHPLSDTVIDEMWPDMASVEGRAEIRRQYDALIAGGGIVKWAGIKVIAGEKLSAGDVVKLNAHGHLVKAHHGDPNMGALPPFHDNGDGTINIEACYGSMLKRRLNGEVI